MSDASEPSARRFQIALSFPGQDRPAVAAIAEALAERAGKERILYDEWYAAEFARPGLDLYLRKLYHDESDLIVCFLSKAYSQREWCGLEWSAIRDLIKQKQDDRIMLLRLDDTEVPGVYSIDGYLDIRGWTPQQVADAIQARLARHPVPAVPVRNRRAWLAASAGMALAVAGAGIVWRKWQPRKSAQGGHGLVKASFSIFRDPDQNSEIVGTARLGQEFTFLPAGDNPNMVPVRTGNLQGWAMAQDVNEQELDAKDAIRLGQGYGYQGAFWKLFFTSPQPEGAPPNPLGIDQRFVDAVQRTRTALDIAVFEMNSQPITDAIVEAHGRGVRVRVVTSQLGYAEKGQTFGQLESARIPVVVRPGTAAFMHNKFAILDGKSVWTGSWNYTQNATYANNENALVLEGADYAARYLQVFNQMFEQRLFGVARKRAEEASAPPAPAPPKLSRGVRILFAPEDGILAELLARLNGATRAISVLAFALTSDDVAEALLGRARQGVLVRCLFERRIARTSRPMQSFCAPGSSLQFRLSSNKRYLHHDVMVLDDETVITGSLNYSRSSLERNDENIVIVPDPLLAKKYMAEFSRLWAKAALPDEKTCKPDANPEPDVG